MRESNSAWIPQQRLFVGHYLGESSGSAVAAARELVTALPTISASADMTEPCPLHASLSRVSA